MQRALRYLSGTATVARYFKQWYEVTSNDLLYFSYVLQRGTVAVDCLPTYEIYKRIPEFPTLLLILTDCLLSRWNVFLPNEDFPEYVCSYRRKNVYQRWKCSQNWFRTKRHWRLEEGRFSLGWRILLSGCLHCRGDSFVSNISGTYGAFHKEWERRSYKSTSCFACRSAQTGRTTPVLTATAQMSWKRSPAISCISIRPITNDSICRTTMFRNGSQVWLSGSTRYHGPKGIRE